MKTLNHSYLSRLDHLRFFAVAAVIIYHCKGTMPHPNQINSSWDIIKLWIYSGNIGVSLFLVLSGFLFCIISEAGKRHIAYAPFIKNRLLRIAPLTIFMFFIAITMNKAGETQFDVLRLLTLQLNTGNAMTGWGGEFYPIGQIWTIAVEFQFYLIFPFLATIMHRDGLKNIIGLIIVLVLVKWSLLVFNGVKVNNNLYHSIIGRLDQFLIGMVLGFIYINKTVIKTKSVSLLMIAASILLYTYYSFVKYKVMHFFLPLSFTFEALICGLLIYGYITIPSTFNKKLDSALSFLGSLTFSMYLTHLAVSKMLYGTILDVTNSPFENVFNAIAFVIPATILVSILTYYYIEKPFLKMRVKYLD
ncbi:acyltransferase [Enterobacter wuhouensis]|uniref:acyltransferase family protein n=1 Tax=Enterobacter wuhouensis TaxID=2529381 RepID=UPI002FDCF2CF